MVPSLQKLCAMRYCQELNSEPIVDKEIANLLANKIPADITKLLFPFLHYRWMEAITAQSPILKEEGSIFLAASMKREEDFWRAKASFFKNTSSLLNIYKCIDTFKQTEFPFSKRICLEPVDPIPASHDDYAPGVLQFPLDEEYSLVVNTSIDECFRRDYTEIEEGKDSVVSFEQFKIQFDIFTEKQLEFINWDNVFVAGGAITASILEVPEEYKSKGEAGIREYFHDYAYESGDIDIFLYGLPLSAAANKVLEIYDAIKKSYPDIPIAVKRTENTISFLRQYPYRCTQVIISNFQDKAEILANFDLDCVCVGYDGKDVWCLPRFREAVNTRVNVINSALKQISYRRILRYRSRGWSFAMPDFITIPFGRPIKDSRILGVWLPIAKMQILHEYDVQFGHNDNLLNWIQESPAGLSVDEGPRCKLNHETYWSIVERDTAITDSLDHWDSSAGYGVTYYRNVTHEALVSRVGSWKLIKDLKAELEKNQLHDDQWTWDGAPEFEDWVFYGTSAPTEIALLKLAPFVTKAVIDITDTSESDTPLMKLVTETDAQGFSWTINLMSTKKGIKIELELNGVPRAPKCNVWKKSHCKDVLCAVVVVYQFSSPAEKKKNTSSVIMDISHQFGSENTYVTTEPVYWRHLEDMSLNKKVQFTADIRALHQQIPYL